MAEDDGVRDALGTLKRYSVAEELSKEIVEALIDKVVIDDPEHMVTQWKFSDEVMEFIGA